MNIVRTHSYNIPEELLDIIPGYLDRRGQDIQELKAALKSEDFVTVKAIGHKLKGNGASYGFENISNLGLELMNASDKQSKQDVFQLTSDLENEVTEIKSKLQLEEEGLKH